MKSVTQTCCRNSGVDRYNLILNNLRLVISIAKSFHVTPIEDVIQEGNIGLIRADKATCI